MKPHHNNVDVFGFWRGEVSRALDKREYLMIIERLFFLFFIDTICCDPSSEPS